jgi:hypothetical protein
MPWTLQRHGDPADCIAVPKGGLYANRLRARVGVDGYPRLYCAGHRGRHERSGRPLLAFPVAHGPVSLRLARSAQAAVLLKVIPQDVQCGLAGIVRASYSGPTTLGQI